MTPVQFARCSRLRCSAALAVWMALAGGAAAQAPGTGAGAPVTFIGVQNQVGSFAAQARGPGMPVADYERRLGSLAARVVILLPQVAGQSQDSHALQELLKSLAPERLARPDFQPAWDRTLAANPAFAAIADPKRSAQASPAARQAELIRELLAVVQRTEAAAGNLNYEQFALLTHRDVMPRLRELQSSALARLRAIPESAGGDHPAFAAIDDGAGGAAFVLGSRWLALPEVRKIKQKLGTRLTQLQQGGTATESTDWSFTVQYLLRPPSDLVEELRPLIAGRIEKAVPAGAVPRLPRPAPGVPTLPAPSGTGAIVGGHSVIYFGTPGQIAFARAMDTLSSTLQQLGTAVAIATRSIAYTTELDDRIRSDRDNFWRCHYARCSDYDGLLNTYSRTLVEKDIQHLQINGISKESVDGGPLQGCDAEFAALATQARAEVQPNQRREAPAAWSAALNVLLASPTYLAYQACRDRREVVLRPRRSFF